MEDEEKDEARPDRRGYAERTWRLQEETRRLAGSLRAVKASTSHLFRATPDRRDPATSRVSLRELHHVLSLDETSRTLDVEGAATYEQIAAQTLAHGLLPTVAPELKGITVGGAISGIGIESSSFRYGFVHDGVLEADVLLPDGRIVTCDAVHEHSDLFFALPNSYGTLGYVVRARIRLVEASPYVRVRSIRCRTVGGLLEALLSAATDPANDFVDGLLYSPSESYAIVARFVEEAPQLRSIYGPAPYYEWSRTSEEWYLTAGDYVFRYDPDWFWNVPKGPVYGAFRRLAPRRLRHSEFYRRYIAWKRSVSGVFGSPGSAESAREPLIQDWEVPWRQAEDFAHLALASVDLGDRPWAAVPIRCVGRADLYPLSRGELYFNLGCYCWVDRPTHLEPHHYTRRLDAECFARGGLKMLYSSTFVTEEEFGRRYNADAYRRLKAEYDPAGRLPTLYEKVAGL